MNIAIQTNDKLICLFTSSIERAESVLKKAQVKYIDIYEVRDDEMQYYYFNSSLYDPKYYKTNQ